MLLANWHALGLFAVIMTLFWAAFMPTKRVYLTSGFSGGAWAIMAFTARDLTRVTNNGVELSVEEPALQMFSAALAVLSFLVLILYRFGAYPPESEPADKPS